MCTFHGTKLSVTLRHCKLLTYDFNHLIVDCVLLRGETRLTRKSTDWTVGNYEINGSVLGPKAKYEWDLWHTCQRFRISARSTILLILRQVLLQNGSTKYFAHWPPKLSFQALS